MKSSIHGLTINRTRGFIGHNLEFTCALVACHRYVFFLLQKHFKDFDCAHAVMDGLC